MNIDFVYALQSEKSFDAVVANIETQVTEHQFRVLAVHDVQATLAEKGLDRGPLKIIEVCNAKFAHEALQKEPDVALFIPCRFSVSVDEDKTIVKLNRPSFIARMLPEAGLETLAGDVEKTLKKIMETSI